MVRDAAAPVLLAALAATGVARAQSTPAPAAASGSKPAEPAARAHEVVVRGTRRSRNPADVTVAAREGRKAAGTQGDPSKVVEDLPGVGRPAFGTGQLIVWGSAPADTRTYVDGVEIPALFHGAALRSTVNGELVRDVTLTPGAYGADYGLGLGGILRVETRDLAATGIHGYAETDTLDGSAMVSGALGDRVRVAVAGRYGWIDGLMKAVGAANVDPYFGVPRYGDYQAKAQVDLREGETLDAVLLGSRDDLTDSISDSDPSRSRSETMTAAFERFYLRYRRALDSGASVDAVGWIGMDASDLDEAFGPNPAILDESTWRAGLRAAHRSRPAPWLSLTLGADIDGESAHTTRTGSLDIPPREGDITAFGEPPGPGSNTDAWNAGVVDLAPYVIATLDLGPLSLTPGLRADAYLLTTSRRTPRVGETPSLGLSHLDGILEPRLSANLRLTSRLALVGTAGLYSQPPDPADLSAVFGNPTLGPALAEHVALGESLRITATLSAEVVGFAKWMTGLAVRNPAPSPALAEALLDEGIGRSYGVQLLLRQQPWHGFFGWLAYTISRSERRDTPGASWRLFDYDQPHVLTMVGSQALGPWTLGARFRFAVGLPRTPVVGAFYDTKDDLFDPVFGAQNSIRLPDFWQLDLRVDRTFKLGEQPRLTAYLEVLNATDHINSEEYVYNSNYTRRGAVTGLPIFPVVGVRVDL